MNERTNLLGSGDNIQLNHSYEAIIKTKPIQPDQKDYTKPSKVISTLKLESATVYIKPSNGTTDLDEDVDESRPSEELLTKCIHFLDLTLEVQERLLYWCLLFILIALTSIERVTFKMIVDNMTPYRVVVEIFMLFFLVISYTIRIAIKNFRSMIEWPDITKFPPFQLLSMTLLDVIQFSGLIMAASGITPTMTLILLHASTPCIVFTSKYLFPNRKYSYLQDRGIYLIIVAIFIAIIHPMVYLYTGHTTTNMVYSSILYVLSAGIQGYSMVYKEYSLLNWSTPPLDIHIISLCLFSLQTILTIILAPFIYYMQVDNITGYLGEEGVIGFPMESFKQNICDGVGCLFGEVPYIASRKHPPYDYHYSNCVDMNIWLIIAYVLSNVAILECIDLILKKRQDLLGRSMIVGVLVAFIALGIYDTKVYYGLGFYGGNIGIFDIIALIILMIGMEIYGKYSEMYEELPAKIELHTTIQNGFP